MLIVMSVALTRSLLDAAQEGCRGLFRVITLAAAIAHVLGVAQLVWFGMRHINGGKAQLAQVGVAARHLQSASIARMAHGSCMSCAPTILLQAAKH
jgi:hypothetical protein